MGTPEDAALGLPLVMTGPDSTRRLDVIMNPLGPNPQVRNVPIATTPGPAKPDKYGEVLAREFDAFVRLRATLKTREQEDALSEYEEAIDASRRARNQVEGGAS